MTMNVYLGCTVMLVVAMAGLMTGFIFAKERKSKLWLVPIVPLSTTVFMTATMYFVFQGAVIFISPWIAVLFIFSEVGALMGCYINEHMEPKSNLIRAVVVIMSSAMFMAFIATILLTLVENIK